MKLLQTPTFQRKYKKLHPNIRNVVNSALDDIIINPEVGPLKRGDLGNIRVHKKRKGDFEILIAYWFTKKAIELIDLGSHENFYRDLKRKLE